MKRLFLLSLALCLLLGASALAESRLVSSDWLDDRLSTPVILSEEALTARFGDSDEVPSQEDVAMLMSMAKVISISPTGDTALLSLENVLFTLDETGIRLAYPSTTRGVADEYNNLQMRLRSITQLMSGDAVTWSPDGRYAVMTDWRQTIQNARLIVDPILIDTHTGELVILATYGTKFINDGSGAMIAACFSRDGQYLYYILWGNIDGASAPTALMRCELASGEVGMCISIRTGIAYASSDLVALADGSLMVLNYAFSNKDFTSAVILTESDGRWIELCLPNAHTKREWESLHLTYGAAADCAVMIGRVRMASSGKSFSAVSTAAVSVDGGESDLYLAKMNAIAVMRDPSGTVPSDFYTVAQGDVVMPTTLAEVTPDMALIAVAQDPVAPVDYWVILQDNTLHQLTEAELTAESIETVVCEVLGVCPSPDGRQLLVAYMNGSEYFGAAVIDLADMTMTTLSGTPRVEELFSGRSGAFTIQWPTDDIIVWSHFDGGDFYSVVQELR